MLEILKSFFQLLRKVRSLVISTFDLFKIGIGPSSSHTVGPMKAAALFLEKLERQKLLGLIQKVGVDLYGSLALTGKGHGTDKALILGLSGELPDKIEPDLISQKVADVEKNCKISLKGKHIIDFDPNIHIRYWRRKTLPYHPNGLSFEGLDGNNKCILSVSYYSIGGGFVVDESAAQKDILKPDDGIDSRPFPFKSGAELLALCDREGLSIAEIQMQNELSGAQEEEIKTKLNHIWSTMKACIDRGCENDGILPGYLKIRRRAPQMYRDLIEKPRESLRDPLIIMDWVNLYALAVNEENAAGSRVVTAPTNGAAGILPAVIRYYEDFCSHSQLKGIHDFLLTASAIGILYAENASISGAEVGCQGEVGVACSMAAAGLTAALGGSPRQVEEAAEIGMEHNLGLTCDPIGGLVQIPCIERNAMGAVKAINAARIALRSDGKHYVSLDSVIKTMLATGADMKTKYKETSRGGLAVNVTEC